MDDVITLITLTREQDQFGVWRETETQTTNVFCRVESVNRAEFFGGGRNGLNPEFEFIIAAVDWNGARELIYHGNRYSVYRVFRTDSDYIELYAERKGGTNG